MMLSFNWITYNDTPFTLLFKDYPRDMIFYVKKISSTFLGREITKRCGNEGQHNDLEEKDKTTLTFLQAGISYISEATDMGADLSNAAFIFAQPGREFVFQAGNGDWEFFFSEDLNKTVHGRCVRKGPKQASRGFWNSCSSPDRTSGPSNRDGRTAPGPINGLLALPSAV